MFVPAIFARYAIRHLVLLCLVAVCLGFVIAGSSFVRLRDVWPTPKAAWLDFRIVLVLGLTVTLGFLTTFRRAAKSFPVFLGYVMLVGVIFSFEDAILNWFVFGGGIATVGGRINILQMTGMAASFAAAFIVRQNALAYDAEKDLRARGVPEHELRNFDLRMLGAARAPAVAAVGGVAALAVLAQLVEWAFGDARIGIPKLDLMIGALFAGGFVFAVYRFLAPTEKAEGESLETTAIEVAAPDESTYEEPV
jgi:hypothetical protein